MNPVIKGLAYTQRILVDRMLTTTADEVSDMLLKCMQGKPDNKIDPWLVFVYHGIINPYYHPSRKHCLDLDRVVKMIWAYPESLYMYGLMFVDGYSEEVYAALERNKELQTNYKQVWDAVAAEGVEVYEADR